MVKRILGVVLVGVLLAGGALFYFLTSPYRGFERDFFLNIPRGSGSRQIATVLAENGVIEHEWAFLAQRALRPNAVLQAGEYRFTDPASVWEVFDRLERGDIYYFDFTVPEGSNIFEIARLLETEGIMKEAEFLKAASDPALIRDLSPQAESLEGYLFPSTYRLSHSITGAELCEMMVAEFRKQWHKFPGAGLPHGAVTLASLVEKETGVADERTLVASVFRNRLAVGMPLGCDPTVIYAALLVGKYRGTIYRSDLDRDHPYNTYKRAGLPPGPIANPGRAALAAALKPADTDYLYFVAKATGGGHVFSTSGDAHLKAVRSYRNARKTR